MSAMTISSLASAGGVGVETIRFYQRRGLMDVPVRSGTSGHGSSVRRYGRDDLDRLHFIRSARTAGFTLEEIGELIALDATDDRARALELAQTRLEALDQKIAELNRARRYLAALAGRCASGAGGPCPILTAFTDDG
jgi:MerR family mercuric resistance operon transcriptional regulator